VNETAITQTFNCEALFDQAISRRGNNLETMLIDRRSFMASAAALASAPALGAVSASGETDVAIIGAGAAGIAAARKVAAAGRRFALIEASDHVGGRCVTDNATFGVPFDRGAHWVHMPDINPVARLGSRSGLEIYPAPPGQKLRIGKRNAREGEMEDYLATLVRANRAIQEAARGKADVSCMQALPKDLGDWRPAVEFALGPFACSKGLEEVSAMDFARSLERDVDAFCRQGFGALLARLAADLPVQLGVAAQRLLSTRNSVEIETTRGRIVARAAIVTVSTGVLGADKLRFDPALPPRHRDAIAKLSPGSYDHVALELKGNPLQLQNDDLVLEKSSGTRTAALLANVSGTPLCMIEVAGKFGGELARQGQAAMVDFATGWLADLYGADIKKAVGRTATTAWSRDPFVLGAFSAAAPGGQPGRRVLMEPIRDRLFFGGEAVHETLWGTVGGAWESGERAADAALRLWGSAPSSGRRR
jgi:monoamine oxidase